MSLHPSRSAHGHPTTLPSPLRHASNASSGSSTYTNNSGYPPSRSSTLSSNASSNYQYSKGGHKRGLSEASGLLHSPSDANFEAADNASSQYKQMRQSLRPLPQVPVSSPPRTESKPTYSHTRSQSVDPPSSPGIDGSVSPTAKSRPHSLAISRSDSVRGSRPNSPHVHFSTHIERPDLQSFQRSTTGHLRTLSRFAENESEADFTIKSPDQEVAGMHGRIKLQRSRSTTGKKAVGLMGWGGARWMDQQRQFLQAYEYLCHIGEAKEWIEDVIHKPIPPVVQLEEALRDGVTLAEVVQALHPEKSFRIFRNPKLQFRHSDNIALFFRYLAEVELPELFRFELVDLYEKKNIPKVIYCIHALSWLLFRKGIVDFRIGNLVGQLQFEDHELEATQKGLDKAGVSMPNFKGMSANFDVEPEPEPQETEEDRINRELAEYEDTIVDLQAQIRGSILRMRLGDTMQQLWDSEEWLIEFQSKLRGDWAREIFRYRQDMKIFAVNLQSAVRGFLIRSSQRDEEEYWNHNQREVVLMQSLARGRKARAETQRLQTKLQRQENGIRSLQAAVRGALKRKEVGDQWHESREVESTVIDLQTIIRGALQRKRFDQQHAETKSAESHVALLQAAARGMLQRRIKQTERTSLKQQESFIVKLQAAMRASGVRHIQDQVQKTLNHSAVEWTGLQSVARAAVARRGIARLRDDLHSHEDEFISLQALARAARIRSEVASILSAFAAREDRILELQSTARGHMLRRGYRGDIKALQKSVPSIVALQSAVQGYLVRQRVYDQVCELHDHEQEIIELQGLARAMLVRMQVGNVLNNLDSQEEVTVQLQALARAKLVRTKFIEKKKFFKENMEKVIKIQSFVRARQQGEAYKSLTSGKNPPVGTVKNFVHLLNDSDFDFDEEIEFERLRKTVVQSVRQNEMAEQYIDQLDIKIALLVKNKITLDEVVKHQKHYGGHVGHLLSNRELSSKDPFDLKALNKNSRRKLEHYQELFFMLQTQPQYLSRLFRRIREQNTPDSECKRIEQLMMGLFGFAQKRREEYYLLKLISKSIREEVDSCASLQDYLRGNFFWNKIFGSYIRSPRDRKFLKDVLGPLIKENIIENEGLDLESDPMQIYRSEINNEELRTGQRSRRNPDVPRDQAIKDPETRATFVRHLEDLRDITDLVFASLEDLLHRMPYGVRFVAQQKFESLRARFQYEDERHLLQIVGQWVWKTYLQQALISPEIWGVVDRGLSPLQKRNLSEVANVLNQVAAGRLFTEENVYLQPLNAYVTEAIERLEEIWTGLINVRDAEAQFDIDEFNDLYARTKPTLFIKLADIFSIHKLIVNDISYLCPNQDDILRETIRELGSAKNNENDLIGVSSTEICLTLNPKLHDVEDPEEAVKALFMETKRCLLYIIRVQTGSNLMEIMVKPITPEDEDRWEQLIRDELLPAQNTNNKARGAYTSDATTLLDITTLTYAELKRTALENIMALEEARAISRHNHWQDLLNTIALDIRTKHRRRIQRARELEGVRATLANLDEKAVYLEQQLKSYNDYIEQAMITLQNKKGKKRFLLPFTKQYNHEKELQRSGKIPKFGSYKYSARDLATKGVLVEWKGYSERQWDKINLTISSDEVGVFHIEGSAGSMMIPGASASVPLDDLLQAQFNNCQFMNLFGTDRGSAGDGALKLNVNLFLHLVFKKFYRDE
ncbi:hypothetical protein M501DRAFT_1001989 [Patellaria atrata CBS 101060]|uniref:Ras GTPase activating protein n=1 Tax=Patellaria atrata CBS 101060 TaxID=1346257 RepID=A0A9P4VPJ7_9PEZI|nr:hypothetical protein M501DRAFT_1001989 [Patellaria atrata CBS 101060]